MHSPRKLCSGFLCLCTEVKPGAYPGAPALALLSPQQLSVDKDLLPPTGSVPPAYGSLWHLFCVLNKATLKRKHQVVRHSDSRGLGWFNSLKRAEKQPSPAESCLGTDSGHECWGKLHGGLAVKSQLTPRVWGREQAQPWILSIQGSWGGHPQQRLSSGFGDNLTEPGPSQQMSAQHGMPPSGRWTGSGNQGRMGACGEEGAGRGG